MPEFCSCGAQLPPDARFCHKCGKPLFEEVPSVPEPEPVPETAAFPVISVPAALDFHNPVAVRVGLSMASLAALLSWLPFVSLGFVIWWTGAGFFSVYLYRRRTGQMLTVRGGLRMGWITGVLTFVIMVVLLTITIVPVALNGGLSAAFQQQLHNMPAGDPGARDAMRLLESPTGMFTVLVFVLAMIFAFVMFLCTAGAALGAKIVGGED